MPFFAMMWANPLVRRISMYVAIAAFALMMFRWYSNSLAEQAERKGQAAGELKQLQLGEEQFKQRIEVLTKMRADLDKSKADSDKTRAAIKGDLAKGVNSINAQLAGITGRVDQLRPDQYDGRIKQLLADLRATAP
jgi:chromosome segregation ATPase